MKPERSSADYFPCLDGVRAIATLAVIGFHLLLPGFSYGWIGVPCFFVLSGFLITGILLDRRGERTYFRNFYLRRTLRIFPIYYLTLLATTVIALLVFKHWLLADFHYYFLYLQNYRLAETGFRAQFPPILNHTWSLAVEEQFYLCWPLVIFVLNRRALAGLCFGLFGVSVFYRAWAAQHFDSPAEVFLALPSCLDALTAGGLLAIGMRLERSAKLMKRLSLSLMSLSGIGCLLMIASLGPWKTEYLLRGQGAALQVLLSIFFVSFLGWILTGGFAGGLLEAGWLRRIGKLSYGLYLYHLPVFFFVDLFFHRSLRLRQFLGDGGLIVVKILLTFMTAGISFSLIESPINRLRDRWVRQDRRAGEAHEISPAIPSEARGAAA
jgi:peptidoglycan/LPS O-acetylase OafA/YrhL